MADEDQMPEPAIEEEGRITLIVEMPFFGTEHNLDSVLDHAERALRYMTGDRQDISMGYMYKDEVASFTLKRSGEHNDVVREPRKATAAFKKALASLFSKESIK